MKKIFLTVLSAALMLVFLAANPKYKHYKGFDLKEFEKSLAYIPTTSFNAGSSDYTPPADIEMAEFPRSQMVTVKAFSISKYEVTNGQYLEYLKDLKIQNKQQEYEKAMPDTLVWRERLAYNEPFVEYYLRHPAYSLHPVVGVTYEQAERFCEWLTQRYMKEEKREYPKAVFRLPGRLEWECAARGGTYHDCFPWKGTHVQKANGEYMANFRNVGQLSIYRDKDGALRSNGYSYENLERDIAKKEPFDAYETTAPSKSFFPNGYGLYNMAGNVEELVSPKGIARGGSWRDPAFYMMVWVEEAYDSLSPASAERGFRIVMDVK